MAGYHFAHHHFATVSFGEMMVGKVMSTLQSQLRGNPAHFTMASTQA
jgi:hypothetical protein